MHDEVDAILRVLQGTGQPRLDEELAVRHEPRHDWSAFGVTQHELHGCKKNNEQVLNMHDSVKIRETRYSDICYQATFVIKRHLSFLKKRHLLSN